MIWKTLYKNSATSHGTLKYFRNKLNRTSLSDDVKKHVDATIDLIYTVVKGHWVACACELLEISSAEGPIVVPEGLKKANPIEQCKFVSDIARKVVERLTLIGSAFVDPGTTADSKDTCYNYARILCHYGSLVMEFRDAWAEGDGERVMRCWRIFLPHFQAAGRTKYSLAALTVQLQTKAILSPNAAHQVIWHRFVNAQGGRGRNIPCDLYNEHINKQVKYIIRNMGSNLTESALQRAAHSVTSIQKICEQYDHQTGVPFTMSAHTTRPDRDDVLKVTKVVKEHNLLTPRAGRKHNAFPKLHLDPLRKWDKEKTKTWIEKKKKEVEKYRRCESEESSDDDDKESRDKEEDTQQSDYEEYDY